jgi:ComF family protein
VDYGYPWAECIADFKFRGQAGWAGPLARLMQSAPGAAGCIASADLVLPMPLSVERLRERGFNQALELARHLPGIARGRIWSDLLLRIRHTPAQSSLDRSRRLANVRGAFAVEPLSAAALEGRRVLLVDDVMTSGASLYEAASRLRQAGAAEVCGLVIARTDEATGD